MTNKNGNTLLLVISVIFVLMIGILKIWKISSLRVDIQNQRENYYKHFYLTDGILNRSIVVAIKDFDQLLNLDRSIKMDFSQYLRDLGYTAISQIQRVIFKKKYQPGKLVVTTFLKKDDESIFAIKCLIERQKGIPKTKINFCVTGFTIFTP